MKKYNIFNQLTGQTEEALTYEDALILQDKIRSDYYSSIEGLFTITVLVKNEDETWTQNISDNQGNPVINPQ
jgi:hypothetical protein